MLSAAPAAAPNSWFQAALPASCRVSIEPLSADPFINTVMPPATGMMIVGAPIAVSSEFAPLCPIHRHPSIAATDAWQYAKITLMESTVFAAAVHGISLVGNDGEGGGAATTFNASSSLIDLGSGIGTPGYGITVATAKILTLFASHAIMPTVVNTLTGGVSPGQIIMATVTPTLPTLSPTLKLTH